MKRKQFVKRLMSIGYDRNGANLDAWLARLQRCPYEKRWRECKCRYDTKLAFEKLRSSLANVGESALNAAKQLMALCAAVKENEST